MRVAKLHQRRTCCGNRAHEESRHGREPRRPNDEADAEAENRAAHEHHGLRVCGTVFEASRNTWHEVGREFDEREEEARVLSAAAAI